MAEGQIIACHTVQEWKDHLEKNSDPNKLVVVDFFATWCGPCRVIAPFLAKLAKKLPTVTFLKVDVDELQTVAQEMAVEAMPTFLFMKGGKVVDTVVGAVKEQLELTINKHSDSYSEFLAVAVDAAKKAGHVIRKAFYETKHVEQKGQMDLVTETDKACEALIANHLNHHFPNHKFVGEETTAACGIVELTDEPTWIVDPVDGTVNFVHGYPFVCVSIGLTIGKVPTVGVVYNPIMEELFTGVSGKGAFLNGNPIKASSKTELVKSLLGTEVVAERDRPIVDSATKRVNSLLFKVRSVRMSGSCALTLCGIACGRIDCFYLVGYGGPWDVAGGAVIVTEAGGVLFDPSGREFDITSQRIAASNPLLKDAFVEALKESE